MHGFAQTSLMTASLGECVLQRWLDIQDGAKATHFDNVCNVLLDVANDKFALFAVTGFSDHQKHPQTGTRNILDGFKIKHNLGLGVGEFDEFDHMALEHRRAQTIEPAADKDATSVGQFFSIDFHIGQVPFDSLSKL